MAKPKKAAPLASANSAENHGLPKTAAEIAADTNFGYKVRVLIYDLRNVLKDAESQQRTLQTTDKLYISSPYFTPEEAAMIKGATTCDLKEEGQQPKATVSVENAIQKAMADFFRQTQGEW